MFSRAVNSAINYLISVPEGVTGEDARYHAFFKIGYWVAAMSHSFWALVFFGNDVSGMAWYNVAVALLFVCGGIIWIKVGHPMWLFFALWLIEIPFHALLATLFTGVVTLFWSVPLAPAIACLLIPIFSWHRRIYLAGLLVMFSAIIGTVAFFITPVAPLSNASNATLFLFNTFGIFGSLVLYLGIVQYIVNIAEIRLAEEFERAEGLLLNILPAPVAQRLKDGERLIANNYDEVSVIFADIVDFTTASAQLVPGELVETLNLVFSEFDRLAEKHGAEKIKTIGDAYMVVVGAPDSNDNHAEVAVGLAVDMQKAVLELRGRTHFEVNLRIGVNTGPVVAGVIGRRKFAYDLWGDAVNVAARMESHGEPGKILTTEITANALSDKFTVKPEGLRDIKGKGQIQVFSVTAAAA